MGAFKDVETSYEAVSRSGNEISRRPRRCEISAKAMSVSREECNSRVIDRGEGDVGCG